MTSSILTFSGEQEVTINKHIMNAIKFSLDINNFLLELEYDAQHDVPSTL